MSYAETLQALREQLNEIDEERVGLVMQKKAIESEQAGITVEIRKNHQLPRDRFRKLLTRQGELNAAQSMIDGKLGEMSAAKRKLNSLIDQCKSSDTSNQEAKNDRWQNTRDALIEMKDRYMDFSSDGTRVSSMRLMASKFVDEIDGVLRLNK